MSRQDENVAIVRRALEAFQRGDMEAFLRFVHPEVDVHSSPQLVNPVDAVGRDEFLKWIAEWLDAWDSFEVEAEGIEPVGANHIVMAVRQRGTGRGSGIEVDMLAFYMFELRDGVTIRYHLYPDREQAMAAAREGEAGGGSRPR